MQCACRDKYIRNKLYIQAVSLEYQAKVPHLYTKTINSSEGLRNKCNYLSMRAWHACGSKKNY